MNNLGKSSSAEYHEPAKLIVPYDRLYDVSIFFSFVCLFVCFNSLISLLFAHILPFIAFCAYIYISLITLVMFRVFVCIECCWQGCFPCWFLNLFNVMILFHGIWVGCLIMILVSWFVEPPNKSKTRSSEAL